MYIASTNIALHIQIERKAKGTWQSFPLVAPNKMEEL